MISVKLVLAGGVTKTVCVPPDKTIRSVLEDKGIDYTVGSISLNGKTIDAQLDTRFCDHAILNNQCTLSHSTKRDNN